MQLAETFWPSNLKSHSAPRTAAHSLHDFLGRYLGDARPESIAGTFAHLPSTLVSLMSSLSSLLIFNEHPKHLSGFQAHSSVVGSDRFYERDFQLDLLI